jgi:hypothetical protein
MFQVATGNAFQQSVRLFIPMGQGFAEVFSKSCQEAFMFVVTEITVFLAFQILAPRIGIRVLKKVCWDHL